jgi:hypothetical protein
VRLIDDFNIHSLVSPAQLTNISCAGLMWPCHIYSLINRWIYRVYSSVTDEYTWHDPRGTTQVYSSVRQIYLGFETANTPFSFPPLSHFKIPARAKRPHAVVASASASCALSWPCHPRRPGPTPRVCRCPWPPAPPTAGRRSPPSFFIFWGIFRYLGIT